MRMIVISKTTDVKAELDAAKRNLNTCVKAVAGLLGNTAAVARSAYSSSIRMST